MPYTPEIPGLTGLVEIGRGGNGVVYRARQEALGRQVAVKVLAARLDDTAAARFAREGQALGMVSGHPNIVPIHQAGTTAAGEPFLVMMLCEHGSLVEAIQRTGRLPVPLVLDLGVRMAGALQTAHDTGILHRDIKPGNILLDSYDAPRLADFGQARHTDVHLTRTGDVVTTPGYAAPEVLTGQTATPSSDVYSLAATLMAALIGSGPFTRDTDESIAAVLLRVLQEPPPDLRPLGVPDAAARTLEHALAKGPGQRPQSAADFGRSLQETQRGLGLAATPLALAGAPPTAVLPTLTQGEPRTVAYPTPTAAATPAAAVTPPPFGSAPTPSPSVGRRPGWIRWAAVGLAAIVVGAGVVVGVKVFAAPDPRDVSNPADLIVAPTTLPGTWAASDQDLNLVDDSVGLIPTDADTKASPTALSECLALPLGQIDKASASAMYYDKEVTSDPPVSFGYLPKRYRLERSVGMVMPSATAARAMVTPWRGARFDQCVSEANGIGATVGGESELTSAAADVAEPYAVSAPSSVDVAIREVRVPLSRQSDDDTVGSTDDPKKVDERIVTVVTAASGTSVIYVVLQTNDAPLTQDEMDTLVEDLVDTLTD